MDPKLLEKIDELVITSQNSEEKYALWRGKINETDEFEWKVIVDCRNNNNDDYLIRVIKR